jgi:hypothetical protein
MILSTSKCGRHQHPEFVLEAGESCLPEVHLRDLVQTIEEMVAQGSVFKPGDTMRIGWISALVQPYDASRLTLHEPDMQSIPVQWVPGVTESLRHRMVQVYTLDSFSLRQEMNMPSFRHTLLVCTAFAEPGFFMRRTSPSEKNKADTGWFVGCLNDGHDHNSRENLRCISLYEAFIKQRGIQNFVVFPIGSMIMVDAQRGLSVWKNDAALSILPGSFLDRALNQK